MSKMGWLHIGENLEMNYLATNDEHKLVDFINKKLFRVADTPLSYRQVNSLDNDQLLGEERKDSKGWREFSVKEMVYINIVDELKKYGVEHKKLNTLWSAFFAEPTPPKDRKSTPPKVNRYVGETSIGIVFSQVEIILVFEPNGDVAFFDPGNYAAHDSLMNALPNVYIKVHLNKVVNDVLGLLKKKPFPITWSSSEEYIKSSVLGVSDQEEKLLEIIRNKDYRSLKIRKSSGATFTINAERSNSEDVSDSDLLKIIKERNFQDISIKKRDGKMVNFKQEDIFKI
jgi:hypothetical protein